MLNEQWLFIKQQGMTPEVITLPHTWNHEDGQDGGNDYFRGQCTYERMVEVTDRQLDEQIYLTFEGVNAVARVLVEGEEVVTHEGGYSRFHVNVTPWFEKSTKIRLTIEVDNGRMAHVYPQKADFTFYGGIYRQVTLVRLAKNHFSMADFGSYGIYVTPTVQGYNGKIQVDAKVEGQWDCIQYTIMEENQIKAEWNSKESTCHQAIEAIRLWEGLVQPFCYRLKAELISQGQVVDVQWVTFGFRTFGFDPQKGFLLNGRSYPLRGVSRHQDRKGVGNALLPWMQEEDMALIKEIGANSIRLAHYQHDPYFYELCDQEGMVVWAEIPYISEHLPDGDANTRLQLTELICQHYNHPSIAVWGLSNEITVTAITSALIENHKALQELAKKLDPVRATTMAHVFMLPVDHELVHLPDVMAYNLYYGWYLGKLEENDQFFDQYHAKYPERMIGLSEYGADCHYKFQNPEPFRGDYSEQYQCLYHEHILRMLEARPYIWCSYLWNMFDFGADGRDEADDHGVNHKGMVSFDRTIKKDVFYLYKAYWSQEPFVHLTGSRYVERTEAVTTIIVYSNQQHVTLYVDGQALERQSGHRIFTFKVPITGSHCIEAKSGNLTERIQVEKVNEANPTYLMACATLNNWFDDPEMSMIEGQFSIHDTIGEIRKHPQATTVVDEMMAHALRARGDVAQNLERNEAIEQMINQSTVVEFVKLAGGSITQEMVKAINGRLTKISK